MIIRAETKNKSYEKTLPSYCRKVLCSCITYQGYKGNKTTVYFYMEDDEAYSKDFILEVFQSNESIHSVEVVNKQVEKDIENSYLKLRSGGNTCLDSSKEKVTLTTLIREHESYILPNYFYGHIVFPF
jgi:hypothetical protein